MADHGKRAGSEDWLGHGSKKKKKSHHSHHKKDKSSSSKGSKSPKGMKSGRTESSESLQSTYSMDYNTGTGGGGSARTLGERPRSTPITMESEDCGEVGIGKGGGSGGGGLLEVEDDGFTPTPVSSTSDPEQTPKSSTEGEGDGDNKIDGKIESKNGGTGNGLPVLNGGSSLPPSTAANTFGSHINFSVPGLSKRCVTLQMLLGAGILKPGEGTMSLEYHGQKFVGDLLENGQIVSQETAQVFSSPSAWATACKEIINPDKGARKSGCGWASIKYKSLKLDYYKAVWFKRLREGAIDIGNINGASVGDDSDEDEAAHCVLKFGEHFETNSKFQTAQQLGSKIMISCTEFKEMERLQPFHVKVSTQVMLLADFHCNAIGTESVGYISGRWNGENNCVKMEAVHPCRVLMPHSNSVECDTERNRIALEIQKLGHDVVGWYHSHPKAPAIPSRDDINRQLDYQIVMKGASESSYIPCVGIIISPLCYTTQEEGTRSQVQFFWVMPPPENRPLELGRPMHVEYETYVEPGFTPNQLLLSIGHLLDFYKGHKDKLDLTDVTSNKIEKFKQALCVWEPELKENREFWQDLQTLFISKVIASPPQPSLVQPPAPGQTNALLLPSNSIPSILGKKEEENEKLETSPLDEQQD